MDFQTMLCLAAAMVGFFIAYRLLTRRQDNDDRLLLPLCPNCGYDLRHSTGNCPECGQPIPDNLRLRADLMASRFPDWLADPAKSIPLRQPAEGEPWRRLYAIMDLRQVRPLEALLERAGIDHRSSLELIPGRSSLLGVPSDHPPMAAVLEVPEADWPVANELSLYVDWAREEDRLEEMKQELGIVESEEEADASA
jgi:hypothetical protein